MAWMLLKQNRYEGLPSQLTEINLFTLFRLELLTTVEVIFGIQKPLAAIFIIALSMTSLICINISKA